MIPKFIKLQLMQNKEGNKFNPVYISIDKILSIGKDPSEDVTLIDLGNFVYKAKESPEQILKLMEEPLVYRE